MKKMKMFFAVAALTLVTVGVFAGKSKFFTNYELFALTSATSAVPIDGGSGTLNSDFAVGHGGAFTNLVTIHGVSTFAIVAYDGTTPEGYVYSNSSF